MSGDRPGAASALHRAGAGRVLVCAFVFAWFGSAGAFDYELRGYLKDYPATWEQNDVWPEQGARSRTWFNSTRVRLKFRWFPAQQITLVADYEARLALTNTTSSLLGISSAPDAGFADMTWTPVSREHVTVTHAVDRLHVQWFSKHFVATLGRQRIGWGVASYFSPLDKFAPFAPAEIDKQEKTGVDAILVSVPWGALSNVEVVYSVGRIRARSIENFGRIDAETRRRLGARFRTNIHDWDVGVVAGRFDEADVVGASLSGYFADAGITGEVLYSRNGKERAVGLRQAAAPPSSASGPSYRYQRGDFVQATLGASYGLVWRNLTLSGEAYYDGSGSTDERAYDWIGLAVGDRLTLAEHYCAGTVSLQPTPLTTLSLTVFGNLDEPAALVQPQVQYSVRENLDVRVGVQANNGGTRSEYGIGDNIAYGIIAWYF